MNRLFPSSPSGWSPSPACASKLARPANFTPGECTFLAPLHYEPNYAYPLVLWLHQDDGDDRQVAQVMPHVSLRNYVAVGVRGTQRNKATGGFRFAQTEHSIHLAESRVEAAIAQAQAKFNVHPQRIFIAGLESGGTMALRLALRQPSRFAGVLSLGGDFPAAHAPLAHFDAVRQLPIFLSCCRDSERFNLDHVCEQLPLWHTAGLKIAIRQYPCGDELTTQMLADMNVWIMERVTGVVTPTETAPLPEVTQWN